MIDQASCRNLLLKSLRDEDFALLAPKLQPVRLAVGELLALPGEPVEIVCFPEEGIITISDVLADGSRVGVGHFGHDGFTGWPPLLHSDLSAHEARVTAHGGDAFHVEPAALLEACRASETLHAQLLRYVQTLLVQLSRTIVSSLTQSVATRLSRWALMGHDRTEGDEIEVTHEEIAVMLAVRRASVTDALHTLEGEGLIRSDRGRVTISDRDGLLRRAGETYGYCEAEYCRLIAEFPHRDRVPKSS